MISPTSRPILTQDISIHTYMYVHAHTHVHVKIYASGTSLTFVFKLEGGVSPSLWAEELWELWVEEWSVWHRWFRASGLRAQERSQFLVSDLCIGMFFFRRQAFAIAKGTASVSESTELQRYQVNNATIRARLARRWRILKGLALYWHIFETFICTAVGVGDQACARPVRNLEEVKLLVVRVRS